MNYNSLFNLLYSTEISEATKAEIINKIQEPIIESCEAEPLVETYLELLDTLIYSTASESLIYNIIDSTFSQLSEEAINEVSDEWVKRKVESGMKARQSAADAANRSVKSGVIGLSQLRKQDKAQSNLERGQKQAASIQARLDKRTPAAEPKAEAPKAESGALGKLKSAVGKVKSWWEKASPAPKATNVSGLSRLVAKKAISNEKAGKEDVGFSTINKAKDVTPKVEEPKATTTPKGATPKAATATTPKAATAKAKTTKAATTAKAKTTKATTPKAVTAKTTKAKTTKAKAITPKVTAPEAEEVKQTPKKGKSGSIKINVGSKINKKAPKVAKPESETLATDVKPKSTSNGISARAKREEARIMDGYKKALDSNREKLQAMKAKPGYNEADAKELEDRISDLEKKLGKVKVTEALADLAILLTKTNISESSFVDVMEMAGASKVNALKVKDRYEQEFNSAVDDINKDVEAGKEPTPEKVKHADEVAKRKEHFEQMFKKRFENT